MNQKGSPMTTYKCAVSSCPGLPWKASERPHPCIEKGATEGDLQVWWIPQIPGKENTDE